MGCPEEDGKTTVLSPELVLIDDQQQHRGKKREESQNLSELQGKDRGNSRRLPGS